MPVLPAAGDEFLPDEEISGRLHEAAKRQRRDKTPFALLYIDLDKFKPINDSLGHEAGDYVLKLIATRMQDILREVDTVARLGGDEFGVILHNVASRENACIASEKLLAAIVPSFAYHSHVLQVGRNGYRMFDLCSVMDYQNVPIASR